MAPAQTLQSSLYVHQKETRKASIDIQGIKSDERDVLEGFKVLGGDDKPDREWERDFLEARGEEGTGVVSVMLVKLLKFPAPIRDSKNAPPIPPWPVTPRMRSFPESACVRPTDGELSKTLWLVLVPVVMATVDPEGEHEPQFVRALELGLPPSIEVELEPEEMTIVVDAPMPPFHSYNHQTKTNAIRHKRTRPSYALVVQKHLEGRCNGRVKTSLRSVASILASLFVNRISSNKPSCPIAHQSPHTSVKSHIEDDLGCKERIVWVRRNGGRSDGWGGREYGVLEDHNPHLWWEWGAEGLLGRVRVLESVEGEGQIKRFFIERVEQTDEVLRVEGMGQSARSGVGRGDTYMDVNVPSESPSTESAFFLRDEDLLKSFSQRRGHSNPERRWERTNVAVEVTR
ncbi:hypothetical protein BKA70DRAFT_1229606 [Coprinopsis sp. MPI-PUGE-AT-0042]|nr:hypothetical protein BKA70DRAFT_1229606 [Coprinopsis sp. MPI-PUGE-AT-0042]